jgi:hypothetical protein
MIQFRQGNLLECEAEALVNPVNCMSVMGKGLPLQAQGNHHIALFWRRTTPTSVGNTVRGTDKFGVPESPLRMQGIRSSSIERVLRSPNHPYLHKENYGLPRAELRRLEPLLQA